MPGNAQPLELTDAEEREVLRLSRLYRREARRCEDAKAYLAGCVLLGAALEAMLIGMVNCFPEEVSACTSLPRTKGNVKPVLRWTLGELVRVTRELAWLPAGLEDDQAWDTRRARIGDYARALQHLRNLVHPARYVADHTARRVTPKCLARSFEIVDAANDHMLAKLNEALRAAMMKEHGA